MKQMILAMTLTALAAPLAAQQSTVQPAPTLPPTTPLPADRGYDKETPRTAAVNSVEAPVTAALNTAVDAHTSGAAAAGAIVNATNQAQYEADMAAYREQVVANHVAVMRDEVRYARQQRAYDDAMTAWRIQASDCQRGVKAACNAPTPNPAAFY